MNPKKNSNRSILVHFEARNHHLTRIIKLILDRGIPCLPNDSLGFLTTKNGGLFLRITAEDRVINKVLETLQSLVEMADRASTGQETSLTIMDETATEYSLGEVETVLTENWKIGFVTPMAVREWDHRKNTILLTPHIRAFGSGIHPSTRLAAQGLEYLSEMGKIGSASVLDVGTGSGILSILSVFLGAKRVAAIDIDQEIIEAARANFILNGVIEKITVTTATLTKLHWQDADVIVANLAPSVTFAILDAMVKKLGSGGCLLLSGHGIETREEICNRLNGYGIAMEKGFHKNHWSAELFVFRR